MATRTNLITNPSLETNLTNWGGSSSATTVTRTTTDGAVGSCCATARRSTTSGSARLRYNSYDFNLAVTAGTTYYFTYKGKTSIATSQTMFGTITYLDAAQNIVGTTTANLSSADNTAWKQASTFTSVAPALATQAFLEWSANFSNAVDTMSVDAVLFTTASGQAYFDGSFSDTPTLDYAWTGTAHASTSTVTDVVAPIPSGTGSGSWNAAGSATGYAPAIAGQRVNLVPNPSFETGTTGWSTDYSTATLETTTQYAWSGTSCLAVGSDGSTDVIAQTAEGTAGMPVVPNVGYTASLYVRGLTPEEFVSVQLTFFNAAGTSVYSTEDGAEGTPDWKRYEVTATAPATAAFASIRYIDYAGEARTVFVDAAMLERADGFSGPYFDGDSDDAAWNGTAHASASTLTLPSPVSIPNPTDPETFWADFDSGTLPTALQTTVGSVTVGTGDAPLSITTVDGRSGDPTHFMQVGAAGDNRDDTITVFATADVGGSNLEFWRRIWTEQGFDFASFTIDGVEQYRLAGKHDWAKMSYTLATGVHTLQWRYTADDSANIGLFGQRITALTITNTSSVVAATPPGAGTSTGAWAAAGTSTGVKTAVPASLGAAAGSWLTEGQSIGSSPALGFKSGFGAGTWVSGGSSSTGRRTSQGLANGSWRVAGAGTSASVKRGSALSSWAAWGTGRGNKTLLPSEQPVNLATDVRLEVQVAGVWTDITGPTRNISISRHDSNPGTLSAEVLDADLDPTQASGIRTGRPVRVQAKEGSTWTSIYTGLLDNVEVNYDPLAPEGKQVNVKLAATDNVAFLANQPEARGVGTINELRWIVTGVPFLINGSSAGLGTGTVVGNNESASIWDQILIARDSNLGYAWVDTENRLRVYDASVMETSSKASLTPNVYHSVDVDFTLDQIINSVVVNWRRYNIGSETSADVPYGPYEDAASIANWGRRQATFTVQGAVETEAAIAAFASDVLSRNKTAEIRAKGAQVPISKVGHLTMVRNVDLNSRVSVTLTDGVTVQVQRVTGISHTITPKSWIVDYEMSKPLALTPPSQTPSTPYTPIPPGTVGEEELDPDLLDDILTAQELAQQAIDEAVEAINLADTKNETFYQPTKPTTGKEGDVWFDTDDGFRTYVHNGVDFVDARDTGISAAQAAASAAASAASAADAKAAAAVTSATNAQTSANGKSKVTYSTSPPGSAANNVGDVWFVKDGSGSITAQWEALGGTSWASRTVTSALIANLDAGKITAGSSFTQSLNVKGLFTLGDAAVNGTIESYNYDASSTGVRISKSGVFAKGGAITGALIQTDAGSNGLKLTSGGLVARDPAGNLKLQFDTASGGLIINGPVTSGGSITGTSVTASALGVIQTESANSRGVKMNSQGLVAYDSRPGSPTLGQAMLTLRTDLGSVAMKGELTSGSKVSGAEITGTVIRTADSGPRVVMGPGLGHNIQFYDFNGTYAGTINAAVAGNIYLSSSAGTSLFVGSGRAGTTQDFDIGRNLSVTGTTTLPSVNVTGAATAGSVRTALISNPNGAISINGGFQLNGGGAINGGPTLNGDVRYQNRPAATSAIPNMRITLTDGGLITNTTHANSSLRYKNDVEDLELTDKQHFDLRPVRYRLKDDPDGPEHWGFIAEELQDLQLAPLLGFDDQGRPDEVDYAKVAVVQQGAIRSLRKTVDDLEQRLAALEASNPTEGEQHASQ